LGKISPSHSEEADISRILITPGKEDLDIERISEHVSCPIFDSYEQVLFIKFYGILSNHYIRN
jgi:hypothetical protein